METESPRKSLPKRLSPLAAASALLVAAPPAPAPGQEPAPAPLPEAGPLPLFDGGDLPRGWRRVDGGQLAAGPGAGRLGTAEAFSNFRLHLRYHPGAAAAAAAPGAVILGDGQRVELPSAGSDGPRWRTLEVAWEQYVGRGAAYSTWLDGAPLAVAAPARGKASAAGPARFQSAEEALDLGGDFTVLVRFRTKGGGTLFSKCAPGGKWVENGKSLFVRGGRLVYDIGWVGALRSRRRVADGAPHVAAVVTRGGTASLFLDGREEASQGGFSRPDRKDFVFKIGSTATDFGGDYEGEIESVRYYRRALSAAEVRAAAEGEALAGAGPELAWSPRGEDAPVVRELPLGRPGVPSTVAVEARAGLRLADVWVQALGSADHAGLIAASDSAALKRGERIYQTLCVTCHGTLEKPGTLPTAPRFHQGPFKNGSAPHRMFLTLTHGFGQMVPQPQYDARQKYDVVHYIRETFLKGHNPGSYVAADDAYLRSLPRGPVVPEKPAAGAVARRGPQYEKMDFGPSLMWTYQVAEGNIAYKGIAVRLDPGAGGVSKGRAWMVYDHDTMRVAAAYSGRGFVDWKGIAFDGSHGTHTSIVGEKAFVNPVGPGWANPEDGSWEDPRFRGRDGKPYGPLPRGWAHYKGRYTAGDRVAIAYTVGDAEVLEAPALLDYGDRPVFIRQFNIGKTSREIAARIAPAGGGLGVVLAGAGAEDEARQGARLEEEGGFHVLRIPARATPARLAVAVARLDAASLAALAGGPAVPDLSPLTRGGPARWDQVVTTEGANGDADGPFAVDVITTPDASANPWESWMRLGGFDFLPGGETAAVCTWMGDVWTVGPLRAELGELRWRRIASGLFQPLGVKVVDGAIYVSCRDQIARLHDLNGDGETDLVESFNNDHQVTEHFHEFAMGLQTDAEGNFYYAKSARHALPALVAHHGTLLRVSADGSRTDILATGFRAANGVCLNPDGTYIVTDQEGHWNPKNRINYVRKGGFYGNMMGYHDVTDASDSAMEQPLCWITNGFDRSPAELLWVEGGGWGALEGTLLNLSYGYGQIFVVPHERVGGQVQGGMCALPLPRAPTGIMRGRFHPGDGQLYTCGLFAWAGNQRQPGGFYRVRYTGAPIDLPVGINALRGAVRLTFTSPLDPRAAAEAGRYRVEAWDLKRTKNYGSKHYNQRRWEVEAAEVSADRKSVTLRIPELEPTWGMSIAYELLGEGGRPFEGVIHNSIHALGDTAN